MTANADRYPASRALERRARALVPGGHHLSGNSLLRGASPAYFARGKGCRLWDADGHEYVDYLMAYGAILLGYADERVDRKAFEQTARGSLLSLNHPLHLEFVETLLTRFDGAEMAVFLKTGSEATTVAMRLARRATGRRKIARAGYHGWHDWCVPLESWVPEGLAAEVLEYDAMRPETLETLLAEHAGQIAAVILAPEMVHPPSKGTLHAIQNAAQAAGAVFVLDEVKTAFRIAPGSMQARFGLSPDLTTVSKALGNGWPIAAVLGRRAVMEAGNGMHYSATYHGDTASMAAALEVLAILDREPVQAHVWRLGERLLEGLQILIRELEVPASAYGEPLPPMPFFRFEHPDPAVNEAMRDTFTEAVLERGILLHPRHLWFVSAAHTDEDIDRTLEAARAALLRVRERHGAMA